MNKAGLLVFSYLKVWDENAIVLAASDSREKTCVIGMLVFFKVSVEICFIT